MSFIHRTSNKSETIEHFFIKVLVWKCCLERGHDAVIEYFLVGTGVLDVFDRSTGVIYEIEPVFTKSKQESKWEQYKVTTGVKDLIVVPYKTIIADLFKRKSFFGLKKEIEKYIRD